MALYPGSPVPLWSSITELCSMKITGLLAKAQFAHGRITHLYIIKKTLLLQCYTGLGFRF